MTEATLPGWDDLTDLDKGAALLHLHKREWEGPQYAVEEYPARYFDAPALTALDERDASRHAASMFREANALSRDEYMRLYDLALDADTKRLHAEMEARAAR